MLRCAAHWHHRQFAGFQVDVRHIDAMRLLSKRHQMPRRRPENIDDLFDYCEAPPKRRSSYRGTADDRSIIVTDDWPERVPIGKPEVRIFEGHLRKELDELFGPLP